MNDQPSPPSARVIGRSTPSRAPARTAAAHLTDVARAAVAVGVSGVMAMVFAISFAAMIYAGPLAPDLVRGIGLTLVGATIMAVVGALTCSYRGTIVQPQDVTAIILAVAVARLARDWVGSADALFATVVVLVASTTAATGLLAVACSRSRLGHVGRFIPHPVLGGFLAATGYLMLLGAIGITTRSSVDLWSLHLLIAPGVLERWLPWLLVGVTMTWLSRRFRHGLVLPGCVVLAAALFYGALWVRGVDLAAAEASGLLLGPFEGGTFTTGLGPWILAEAHWPSIAAQAPVMLAVAGMAILGALLYASALEIATHTTIDPNRDLRAIGAANLLAACSGGLAGYHSMSETLFARALGVVGVFAGLGAALVTGLTLFVGAGLVANLPVGVFAAVIAFLGVDLLYTWLWDERRRLSSREFGVVLVILAVAASAGFMTAIVVGLLAAALLFVVSYAQLDVVRLRTSAAAFRSRVERPAHELRWLAEHGHQAAVYRLSGYVFFGTASRLGAELHARLAEGPDRFRFLIVDFRRVPGVDASAAFALAKLHRACAEQGVDLLLSGMGPAVHRELERVGLAGGGARLHVVRRLDDALRWAEDRILAEAPPEPHDAELGFLAELGRRHPHFEAERHFACETVAAGQTLYEENQFADGMVLLRSGRLRAEVPDADGTFATVAIMRPGTLVGEIGFYAGVPRTARVSAETDAEVLRLDAPALRRLEVVDPALAADLHRLAAGQLAHRLMRTTRLLRDADP